MKRILITCFIIGNVLILHGQPLADGLGKFLGCAYSTPQAPNFARYWNQVTPENGGKWGSVEANRDLMNWTALDAAYNVASGNDFAFKNHTLIWGNQQPTWIENLDTAEQRQEIEEWFMLTAAQHPDMEFIDVVNEPLHAPPSGAGKGNYMKALGGSGTTGWDWVIRSFKLARKYFPGSKLLINEYNVTNNSTNAQKYVNIINLLKADSLIDGVGIQAHAFSTLGVSAGIIKSNLDLIASTGLPIYISELDIDGTTDVVQLKEYMRVFPVFWEHPAVAGITLWGFRYGLWRTDQGAYLVTQAGTERTAFKWLKAYVRDTLTLSESVNVSVEAGKDTIFIDEDANLFAHLLPENTTIKNVTWSVTPSSVATINNNGLLVPKLSGKATVKATSWDTGKTGTKDIIIRNRPVDSIIIELMEDTVFTGQQIPVSVAIYPENATNREISWVTMPAGLITVHTNDSLTAEAAGNVSLVAKATDGSGKADTVELTIMLPTGININPDVEISIYPNPSRTGKFQISNMVDISGITIIDMKGRIVVKCNTENRSCVTVEITNSPGLYLIILNKGTQLSYRKIRVG